MQSMSFKVWLFIILLNAAVSSGCLLLFLDLAVALGNFFLSGSELTCYGGIAIIC